MADRRVYKDTALDELAANANVAQFVSFSPGQVPKQRLCRIHGYEPNRGFGNVADAIAALFNVSSEGSVNVRSFRPENPAGQPFLYGLKDVDTAVGNVRHLAAEGLHTIVNETIDVHDGGVSGVSCGGVIEFAPDDTPRCVEKPGNATFPAAVGMALLATVYGFTAALDYPRNHRVEFSIHPIRRGYRHEHTVIWQREETEIEDLLVHIGWPNRFSRFLGDKAFGLLVAEVLGAAVPTTTVLNRRVSPFRFGRSSGTGEIWIRTCPVEQVPGHFATRFGWSDPFQLLAESDPTGSRIPSILSQEGVQPEYSGASAVDRDGRLVVQGVHGPGAEYMKGLAAPEQLPADVAEAVAAVHRTLSPALGDIRLEWVYDGRTAWVVQLHRGRTEISGGTIYPGAPEVFHEFDVREGLEALRQLIARLDNRREGVIIVGNVGITSHIGDVLRRSHVPSRIERRDNA